MRPGWPTWQPMRDQLGVLVPVQQNWQSEFLAVAALTVLGIFLRQRGSPESKPVAAPHAQTGTG